MKWLWKEINETIAKMNKTPFLLKGSNGRLDHPEEELGLAYSRTKCD